MHHGAAMRTTLNLSAEAHGLASSLARDEGISLSDAVNRLIVAREAAPRAPAGQRGRSRLPVFACVRRVSSADVRALEDEP